METLRIDVLGSGMIPVPPPAYGAVERHIDHLARALSARGHDVRVLARVFGPQPWNEYRFAWWARAQARARRPDVVHAHTTGVASVLAATRTPFAYTSHSRHWASRHGIREQFGFRLERHAIDHAHPLIALTEDVAEKMRRLGASPHVVPNGVDPEAFRPDHQARDGRTVLLVGAVVPHKAPHVVAEAARGLDCQVLVAGPTPDPAYKERLQRSGARLLGPVDDDTMRRLYATSDIFAHLSTSEALSMAVLEAMAAGLPLVATAAMRDQVEDGATGLAVPEGPDDVRIAATQSALQRLLEDAGLRRRLGDEGRKRAIDRFSWTRVAADVEAAYRAARP